MSRKLKIILISFLFLSLFVTYKMVKPYYQFLTQRLQVSPVKTLLFSDTVKKIDGTVNILILGIAGGTHDGPNLSDSIIVAHYDFKTDKLTTIGIPRDVWSETLKDKINTAYAYGEAKQEDGGLKLAKAEVGAIVGMPIQYSMVISFSRFKDLIDYLGGIDVDVQKGFTDKEFPIEGKENDECGGDKNYKCRYETITFTKGKTHMNGTTALKFVRSRHAEGDEGNDFARSRRQQIVIAAMKDKMVQIVKSYDLKKIDGLYAKADSLVNRDVTNQEIVTIGKDIFFSKTYTQKSFFLPEDLFTVPPYTQYEGKYVLIPTKGWDNVHSYVNCLIEKNDDKSCASLIEKREEDH
jgi:polyisoprenyl-teichoic acid--peptidoglycan teichoic acid transferase